MSHFTLTDAYKAGLLDSKLAERYVDYLIDKGASPADREAMVRAEIDSLYADRMQRNELPTQELGPDMSPRRTLRPELVREGA